MDKEEEKSLFVQLMGKSPMILVIDTLLDNLRMPLTQDMLFLSCNGVTEAEFVECLERLEELSIVKIKDVYIEAGELYCLNVDSPIVKSFIEIEMDLIRQKFKNPRCE